MRVLINEDPFPLDANDLPWSGRGQWPCHWVSLATLPPFVGAFRLRFSAERAETVRVHVTADERYELWFDGTYVGRGSERGDLEHWFFETYDLELTAGDHELVAKVWALGEKSAFAQHSSVPGFLLCPQDEAWQKRIGTGLAPWEAKLLEGIEFVTPQTAWGTGWNVRVTGDLWGQIAADGYVPVIKGPVGMATGVNDRHVDHLLLPATLPPMLERPWDGVRVRQVSNPPAGPTNVVPIRAEDDLLDEHEAWAELRAIHIPAHTRKRVLLDLDDYVCAYPRATLSGGRGASVRIDWQESLYEGAPGSGDAALVKGNRDEVEGKYFNVIWHNEDGVGDTFVSQGGEKVRFDTLWWQAGRYVEILVETQDEPLTIDTLDFYETHYPYEFDATFEASDDRLESVVPIMRRVLEMCSHETYMDCPYYEQLQYVGDTRLQVLVTYTQTEDDRMPRKALRMFDASRQLTGLTQSRYPNRVRQIIPPFSLWYVAMVHDYAMWRGDLVLVQELIPGVRGVLDAYRSQVDEEGLLGGMDGWNFVDWVPSWHAGMPKDAAGGVSAPVMLQLVLALQAAAKLETLLGEPEMAQRHHRTADLAVSALNARFWCEERGIYANDLAQTEFSEHVQCLALLTGAVPSDRRERVAEGLLNDKDLDRVTIYFSHYLFETYRELGRTDRILDRMPLWFDHVPNGLRTTIEMPEPTRSDCHAWGAHPLYHYFASILGIRPIHPGSAKVEIRPQLGPLRFAKGTMPTPLGEVSVHVEDGRGTVRLPEGMTGELVLPTGRQPLKSGETTFDMGRAA